MNATCPFCIKIANGGDEHGLTVSTTMSNVKMFVPLNPVTEGHMLFVPTTHYGRAEAENLISADIVDSLVRYAKDKGIESYNIIQSNGKAATQTVDHVHFHLVPRREGDGLKLPWSDQVPAVPALDPDTLREIANIMRTTIGDEIPVGPAQTGSFNATLTWAAWLDVQADVEEAKL